MAYSAPLVVVPVVAHTDVMFCRFRMFRPSRYAVIWYLARRKSRVTRMSNCLYVGRRAALSSSTSDSWAHAEPLLTPIDETSPGVQRVYGVPDAMRACTKNDVLWKMVPRMLPFSQSAGNVSVNCPARFCGRDVDVGRRRCRRLCVGLNQRLEVSDVRGRIRAGVAGILVRVIEPAR